MKERKVTAAQQARAQREMLAAVEVYRRRGVTREKLLEIVRRMYDFQVDWAATVKRTADRGG